MGEGRAAGRRRATSRGRAGAASDELQFWAGLAIAQEGDVAAGADAVRRAAAVHPAGSRCSSGSRPTSRSRRGGAGRTGARCLTATSPASRAGSS